MDPMGEIDTYQLFATENHKNKAPSLNKFLKQILSEMMSHRINKGILSDSYSFIFLEIDLKRFENELKPKMTEGVTLDIARETPFNYIIKSGHSPNITLKQTLLEFFNDCIVDSDTPKTIKKQMNTFIKYYTLTMSEFKHFQLYNNLKPDVSTTSHISSRSDHYRENSHWKMKDQDELNSISSNSILSTVSSKSSNESGGIFDKHFFRTIRDYNMINKETYKTSIDVHSNDFEILKYGYSYFSQVFLLEAKYLLNYLKEPIRENDFIAIKIHDPRYYPIEEFQYDAFSPGDTEYPKQFLNNKKSIACFVNYSTEMECHEILRKEPNFNSIAYDQKDLYLLLWCQDKIYHRKGWTNIFKHIENIPMPKDEETYEKAIE